MTTFESEIKEQMTLRQFAAQHGLPTSAGFLELKDAKGIPFACNGMHFGSTFVIFAKKIVEEHQGANAFDIAKDILQNAKNYQVIAKPGVAWNNGKPIYVICKNGSKMHEVGGSLKEFCNF